ncbi:TIGR02453 family protein [bacterium]|nr:TIGR02453 family protein [bacterium]
MIAQSTIDFLQLLSENNNKEWFNNHHDDYNQARDNAREFVQELISGIAEFDHHLEGLEAEDCMFRIYRDTKQMGNAAPYKTHFGAYIALGGRNSNYAGYYFKVAAENSMLGGGMYQPGTPVLRKIRQEIDNNPSQLLDIIETNEFKQLFGEVVGEKLDTAPKGYPRDHEHIELLKLKSYFVVHSIAHAELTQSNSAAKLVAIYKAMHPFNRFLNETFIS